MNKKVSWKQLRSSKLFTLALLLVIVAVIFAIATGGRLLRPKNIRNILQSITVVSFLSIGSGMLMISGQVDLSVAAVGTFGPMVLASLLVFGLPWYFALIIALIASAVFGAVNAFLVNYLKFPAFIATLGMASVAKGIAYIIGDGKNIDIKNDVFAFIGTTRIANYIPVSIFLSLLFLIVYGIILKKTRFGRMIYLVGGNPEASRLAGLKPKLISFVLFINASCLGCISGIMLSSRLKTATCEGISASQFTGITAAVLGGVSFGGGSGGMGGVLIGIFLLNLFDNGLQLLSVPTYWQTVASGLLLIAALVFDTYSSRKKVA